MKKLILLGLISAFADCKETAAMRKFESLSQGVHERLPFGVNKLPSSARIVDDLQHPSRLHCIVFSEGSQLDRDILDRLRRTGKDINLILQDKGDSFCLGEDYFRQLFGFRGLSIGKKVVSVSIPDGVAEPLGLVHVIGGKGLASLHDLLVEGFRAFHVQKRDLAFHAFLEVSGGSHQEKRVPAPLGARPQDEGLPVLERPLGLLPVLLLEVADRLFPVPEEGGEGIADLPEDLLHQGVVPSPHVLDELAPCRGNSQEEIGKPCVHLDGLFLDLPVRPRPEAEEESSSRIGNVLGKDAVYLQKAVLQENFPVENLFHGEILTHPVDGSDTLREGIDYTYERGGRFAFQSDRLLPEMDVRFGPYVSRDEADRRMPRLQGLPQNGEGVRPEGHRIGDRGTSRGVRRLRLRKPGLLRGPDRSAAVLPGQALLRLWEEDGGEARRLGRLLPERRRERRL